MLPKTQVTAVLGGNNTGVTGVSIRTGAGDEASLPCQVVFFFVGLKPDADYLPPEVSRDENGAVVTDESLGASLPGPWAIGAVRSGFGGLLSDVSADAARVVAAI